MTSTTTGILTAIATTLLVVGLGACQMTPSHSEAADDSGTPIRDSSYHQAMINFGRMGAEDGRIPDGTQVGPDDLDHPGVENLDPQLRAAMINAAQTAHSEGIELGINSGWRSARYQQKLLDEAVSEYGSRDEASKWVQTPEQSQHVHGRAVDVGPPEAAEWLDHHGSRWGLCRIYANEPWHFELAVPSGTKCPALVETAAGSGSAS